MPAGSPIDTATGMARAGAVAGWRARGERVTARSSELDVRILPEVAQMALSRDLEFPLRQLFLRFLALLLVGLERTPAADGVDLDAGSRGRRRQHVAVPGVE